MTRTLIVEVDDWFANDFSRKQNSLSYKIGQVISIV
jgi:hypothetical protein